MTMHIQNEDAPAFTHSTHYLEISSECNDYYNIKKPTRFVAQLKKKSVYYEPSHNTVQNKDLSAVQNRR